MFKRKKKDPEQEFDVKYFCDRMADQQSDTLRLVKSLVEQISHCEHRIDLLEKRIENISGELRERVNKIEKKLSAASEAMGNGKQEPGRPVYTFPYTCSVDWGTVK